MAVTTATKTALTIPSGMDWAAATAADSAIVSADISCTTKLVIAISTTFARSGSSAFTTGKGPRVRVETSLAASGVDNFSPYDFRQIADGLNIASTTVNGAISAGASSFVVTSATNFVAGEYVFVGDASTANYEVVQIRSISGTTLNIVGTFQNSHTTGATVTSQAENPAPITIDLSAFQRVRIIMDSIGSGQSFFFRTGYGTLDSLTTT